MEINIIDFLLGVSLGLTLGLNIWLIVDIRDFRKKVEKWGY